MTDVGIGPGFWGDRQSLNGEVVLDYCLGWMQRLGWIANFRATAVGEIPATRSGREFSDADVYKLVEALCWEAARTCRSDREDTITELGEVFAVAQQPDGYLNTHFCHLGPAGRYRDMEWGHELYCHGHLIQAGVARLRTLETSADDPLVWVARRAADHVCQEFGPDGRPGVDGHPEIEMALVELYRATGEERYLEQARLFVERRGDGFLSDIEFGRAYFQDDVPVRAAKVLRGHAVRALYLACGTVDVAVETGDGELLETVAEQWTRTIAARTYLTGGMGSRHYGEAFGDDYELPPDRAYAETCAGVASVMLAWRLLLATGEARYADMIERTLFNVVATSVAPDGRAFFYTNPLQVRVRPEVPDPELESPRPQTGLRAPWFTTACCPPNIARMLASLSAYVATTDESGIQLHLLVPGEISAPAPSGGTVRLRVETDYPWSGQVTVHIEDSPAEPWRLAVRIPPWSAGSQNDRYVSEDQVWRRGDEMHLDLAVKPRWTYPDPRVDAVRGTVAVERGPLVYCAESPTDRLDLLTVDDSVDPVDMGEDPMLDRAVMVGVTVRKSVAIDPEWPYQASPPSADTRPRPPNALIPYCLWGNRGPVTMRVWLPQS